MNNDNKGVKQKDVLKLLKSSKDRKKQGRYIVEGTKMTVEAIKLNIVCKIFISQKWWDEYIEEKKSFGKYSSEELEELVKRCDYDILCDKSFDEMVQTVTPQGIMAVVKRNDKSTDEIVAGIHKEHLRFLILENLQDPGNLGTIIRTAEAAGYDGILMNKGTVDIYNPKVVRATMGAIFRVPFAYAQETKEMIDVCRRHGITVYGAALDGEDIRREKYGERIAFVIGNEANGITKETLLCCDRNVRIPMAGNVESLNAAVAAGLLMYISNLPYLI